MTLSHSVKPVDGKSRKLATVLFVEDSHADIALTKAILKMNQIHFETHFLRDGEEAINFFSSGDALVKTLDLIFMDFNLPKRNGLEILDFIKTQKHLTHIPVVMLSGSDAPTDMSKAQDLGAVDYIIKPLSEDQMEKAIKDISSLEFIRKDSDKYLYAAL